MIGIFEHERNTKCTCNTKVIKHLLSFKRKRLMFVSHKNFFNILFLSGQNF